VLWEELVTGMKNSDKKTSFSISELAHQLEISPSSIRFYEVKGLIKPDRSAGNQRIYSKRNRARLKLILRGKRFGFSLNEIAEMIGAEEANMDEVEQIDRSQIFLDQKIEEIQLKRIELDYLEKDLLSFKNKLVRRRKELEGKPTENLPD
jgi:DNA-binding transcriptional MerR regulator